MNTVPVTALQELQHTLEDMESRLWLQGLLDLHAQGRLPEGIASGLIRWYNGERLKDLLEALYKSVSYLLDEHAPVQIPVPVPRPVAAVSAPLAPADEEEDEYEENPKLCLKLWAGLAVCIFAVIICLLMPPFVPEATRPHSPLEGLTLAEHMARRASVEAAVCLRMVRRYRGTMNMTQHDTLLTRSALLALSPAVSKAWAFLPMRRTPLCNCTSRAEFARYKNATETQLQELRAMIKELKTQGHGLGNTMAQKQTRLDMFEDSFYGAIAVGSIIWTVSAAGIIALVYTGVMSVTVLTPSIAFTSTGLGVGALEMLLQNYEEAI